MALNDTRDAKSFQLHALLDGGLRQVLRQVPGQGQEPLAVLLRRQALDVDQEEDVDDEADHVAVQLHHLEDGRGHEVPFDGTANALPEQLVDEALDLLVLVAAKVEKAGFRNGRKASSKGLDAATEKEVCIFPDDGPIFWRERGARGKRKMESSRATRRPRATQRPLTT